MKWILLPIFVLSSLASCSQEHTDSNLNVIYGADDRKEVYKEKDEAVRNLAKATAAIMKEAALVAVQFDDAGELINVDSNGDIEDLEEDEVPHAYNIKAKTFGEAYKLCEEEPYREQQNPAFCSSFLVAPDLVATAGHCVKSYNFCKGSRFVFNYSYDKPKAEKDLSSVAVDDVYNCKEIVAGFVDEDTELDFAIVRLDRPVPGVTPLTLRQSGKIKAGTPLVVIGYPAGLPAKVISGGGTEVTQTDKENYFVGNLDTYGGNSGSVVFNGLTNEVEGILVRGESDFIESEKGCKVSNKCNGRKCRGEDVNRIASLSSYLNALDLGAKDEERTTLEFTQEDLNLVLEDDSENFDEIDFRVEEDRKVLGVKLTLVVAHSRPGDIKVALVHPEGARIELDDRDKAKMEWDLKEKYEFTNFVGKSTAGLWRVVVMDTNANNTGYVAKASLFLTTVKQDGDVEPAELNKGLELMSTALVLAEPLAIPDGAAELTIAFPKLKGKKEIVDVTLELELEHPYVSDVTITLQAPNGQQAVVLNNAFGSRTDLNVTFGTDNFDPAESLKKAFAGKISKGVWKLLVKDNNAGDAGKLKSAKLNLTVISK